MAVHVVFQLFCFFLFVCDIRKLFLFPTLQVNSQQPHILTKFRQPKYTKKNFFLLQLKQKVLTHPAKESDYKKDNIVQINKVRSYVRKCDYLLYPFEETEHLSTVLFIIHNVYAMIKRMTKSFIVRLDNYIKMSIFGEESDIFI